MKPWTVRRSTRAFADRWLNVRADDCETETGHAIAPFYVLEYPDWINVVALDEAGRVLLVRQYRHGIGRVTLGLPAGTVDAEDADPVACAQRELLEETGYAAERMALIASLSPNTATHANRAHTIVSPLARYIQPPVTDPTEVVEVVPTAVGDAVRMALSGEIEHAMHVAALLIGLESLGVAGITAKPVPAARLSR